MNKTIHSKLTVKNSAAHMRSERIASEDFLLVLKQERDIIKALRNEILQPRPQAIANLLKLAREI